MLRRTRALPALGTHAHTHEAVRARVVSVCACCAVVLNLLTLGPFQHVQNRILKVLGERIDEFLRRRVGVHVFVTSAYCARRGVSMHGLDTVRETR